MKIAISSGNEKNRKKILTYLSSIQENSMPFKTNEYKSGADLLEDLRKGLQFDVIFLDVDYENVAKNIRELDRDVMLIFESHSYDQISNAFEVHALHYLLNPIDFSLFLDALRRAFQRYYEKRRIFIIEWKQQIKQILLKNIVYVECFNRHILVRTLSDEMQSYQTFRETVEKLIPLGFIRVHHSFLVNLAHIVEIDKNEIIGTNGIIIPISTRRKKEVLEKYRLYVEKHSV